MDTLKRVTYTEFLLNHKNLPKAPEGLNKKADLTGLIFGKLLVTEKLDEDFFCVKWRCRCLCSGTRDVRSKNLLRGVVADCGCRALWRQKKQRQKARKEREAARIVELERRAVERQERRERNAAIQKKRQEQRKQCKAAAIKRWTDYRARKGENDPKICEQEAA